MKLKLISSVPCKRFEPHPLMCADGRGGWVLSQVNVDRAVSELGAYWVMFGLGVMIEDAHEVDYVEATRLTACLQGRQVGCSELQWYRPNRMWGYHKGDAIVEWVQRIEMELVEGGLISIQVDVKLNSQPQWLTVEGNAYCRVLAVEPDVKQRLDRRFVSPLWFKIKSLFQKPFYPKNV